MFDFTEYIDVRAFFISLFIGILITYVLAPPKKYVIAYPTPETSNEKVYRDKADTCYKFKTDEVQCPTDKSKIHSIEIQDGGNAIESDNDKNAVLKTLESVLDFDKK